MIDFRFNIDNISTIIFIISTIVLLLLVIFLISFILQKTYRNFRTLIYKPNIMKNIETQTIKIHIVEYDIQGYPYVEDNYISYYIDNYR